MSLRLDYVNDERHHCLARGEETKGCWVSPVMLM
jgi:hypothetical protein